MRIVFDPKTLHQSKMGSVTAVVYFDFGGERQFPGAGWSDFVVVVVNWWLAALDRICQGEIETELRFMDGSYWVVVVAQDGANLLLRCTGGRQDAEEVYEVVVRLRDLRSELNNLASKVSQACAMAGIQSVDLDHLRKHLLN
ncbi:hypothetical protein CQ14_26225 [Bradyrhizobium lablabi]|uniref:Uncharacterized protein n=1 Tax=Bradyrhizobium lablabi TaxID=722472 RepID=A0A0R3MMI2_9BRAD|nr:hypothetical protein [Bradyrhizobium lablabi]KRR20798.1 hypothetical protein CQ14_26225 [Bradyrhizobium lablabi]